MIGATASRSGTDDGLGSLARTAPGPTRQMAAGRRNAAPY